MHPMGDSRLIKLPQPRTDVKHLLYVPIPKNASCWVKHHLEQVEFLFYNYYQQGFDSARYKALVILRDPVERWISGVGQIITGLAPGHPMHIDSIDWDQFTLTIPRNNHTQPQHEFFANIPKENIIWFRCDNDLELKFTHCLRSYGINIKVMPVEADVDNVFNVTKRVSKKIGHSYFWSAQDQKYCTEYEIPTQQTIVDQITAVLKQRPEYCDRIKNLYQRDLELFNTVPYYDPR